MSQTEKNGAVSTMFSYKGSPEFHFDVRDAADSEKYENALDAVGQKEQELPKDGKLSEITRAHCAIIKRFFDDCLGEGAAQAIFGDKDHLQDAYDAYAAFIRMISAQRDALLCAKNLFSNRENRQQRRRKNRNRGKKK